MSAVESTSTSNLKTRLLLNSVVYGGIYTTGFLQSVSSTFNNYQPTVFKTVHTNLAAGTAVEFKVQFKSATNGQFVSLANNSSSITMTVSEIAQ